jgi:DNA-binding GntR family transcriptional regulator
MVAHREFHLALLSGARSQRLQGIAANLRAAAEVYRRQSTPFEQSTARNVAAEHKELAELALQRKPEEAAEALTRHLTLTQTLVIKGLGAAS